MKFLVLAENTEAISSKEIFEEIENIELIQSKSLDIASVTDATVIVLLAISEKWASSMAFDIKSRRSLFLKPLIVVSNHHIGLLTDIADEEIVLPTSRITVNSKLERISRLIRKIEDLDTIPDTVRDETLSELLLLRFFYTRNNYILTPLRDIESPTGYTWPVLRPLISAETGRETEILDELENTGLISGTLIDNIHLCPFCRHFQVNFREVCIHCHSLKVTEEVTIHHYRCAYVGREREYKHGYSLICPKCDKELRHIGVDYDKPSEDFWCNDCGEHFSEPLVSCYCLNCGKTFTPDDAILRPVKEYTVTSKGIQAAEEGFLPGISIMNVLRNELVFYTTDIFRELLKLEILRCKRYEYDSILVRLTMGNFDALLKAEGLKNVMKLRKEVAGMFKLTFRETDFLSDISDTITLIIMTHTNKEQAITSLERLKEKSRSLFIRDIDFDYSLIELRSSAVDIEDALKP